MVELSDFLRWPSLVAAPIAFVAGVNIRTFTGTMGWFKTHKISGEWNEEQYMQFKEFSRRGYMVYYLGYFGRQVAYKIYSSK